MPTISRFFGIEVVMRLRAKEHDPPHLHFKYGKRIASIRIDNQQVLAGKLPGKQLKQAQEWIRLHKEELLEMWESQNFHKVEPLK